MSNDGDSFDIFCLVSPEISITHLSDSLRLGPHITGISA